MSIVGNDRVPGPEFFKVLLTGFEERLSVPPRFVRTYLSDIRDFVSIRSPHRQFWHLKIKRNEEQLYFDDGWGEFCKHNDIHLGYFLVFRYEGNSVFTLKVFDLTGCLVNCHIANNRHKSEVLDNVSESLDVPVKSQVKNKKSKMDMVIDEIDIKPTKEILQKLSKEPVRRKSSPIVNEKLSKDAMLTKSCQKLIKSSVKDLKQPIFSSQDENFADYLVKRVSSPRVKIENSDDTVQRKFQVQEKSVIVDRKRKSLRLQSFSTGLIQHNTNLVLQHALQDNSKEPISSDVKQKLKRRSVPFHISKEQELIEIDD